MSKQQPNPNVLLICVDQWPGKLLGTAGHPSIQTPTLDQLARNGIRFTQAYASCPVCIPSRRSQMTGVTPRTHGDRVYSDTLDMPPLPTLAQTFRDSGYQTCAVGKMHVYPQRDRVGFDDVILAEEGRVDFGVIDDYEMFLGDHGYAGQQFAHGMSNNDYLARSWHLPEQFHITNWTTQQMARVIKRRDPTRPAFWYLSYTHPHSPLAPLSDYLDLYRDIDPGEPLIGEWVEDKEALPFALRARPVMGHYFNADQIRAARRAFYALCTHIDHQLRVVIGTLREEGLLDNTIILFHADHGDMLGNHGLWAKRLFYEDSAKVPMILVGTKGDELIGHHRIDNRIVSLEDIMPTLLSLAGIPIPKTVEGVSMIGSQQREWLYGEYGEDEKASRMIHDGRYKLIYYAVGNIVQLFDLQEDPDELKNLAQSSAHADILERLTQLLIRNLYGSDEIWVKEGQLVGLPDQEYVPQPDRGLGNQRGIHWPPPPTHK